ncbi:MAG: MucBP domain-containing protein [Coprococcus sp.]
MKKYKKLFVSLLAAAVLTVGSAFSVMAADTYTYKVTVYAGNKGTIDGQEQKEITGLSFGSQVILDINSVKVTDDKYYVKGFRLSGRDNEEALATPTIEVDGDVDYVVAYGIKGDMVAYTVNYQDANGKTLADSQTFYGNAGDKPVVAYKYIENYIPQALALTKTLSDNESQNVFTFTYTPGETDRIVETTTTVTTIVPGPTTTTTTTGTTGYRYNRNRHDRNGYNRYDRYRNRYSCEWYKRNEQCGRRQYGQWCQYQCRRYDRQSE